MADERYRADGAQDDSWWFQDENAQRGFPPEEDLPQDGAYDGAPEELIERFAEAERRAIALKRETVRRIEAERRAFLKRVRDRNTPATVQAVCALLRPVLSSDNARAVRLASESLTLIARIAVAPTAEKPADVRTLYTILANAPYETDGYDRDQLRGACELARRLYAPTLRREPDPRNREGHLS